VRDHPRSEGRQVNASGGQVGAELQSQPKVPAEQKFETLLQAGILLEKFPSFQGAAPPLRGRSEAGADLFPGSGFDSCRRFSPLQAVSGNGSELESVVLIALPSRPALPSPERSGPTRLAQIVRSFKTTDLPNFDRCLELIERNKHTTRLAKI